MRMRSPKIAPPVTGLDGSTAITPAVLPSARSSEIMRSHSVLLPAPGAPVIPMMSARPACWAMLLNSLAAEGLWSSMMVAARARARGSPRRTLFVSSAISAGSAMLPLGIEKLARDHQPLDLARSLTDGAQLHVAVKLFHRVILQEPVAAMNLHGF